MARTEAAMATHEPVLVLGPDDAGRLVSAEEFAAAEFQEPWRYERAAGRLIVMAPSGEDHVNCSEPWRDHLVVYKLAHPNIVQRVASEAWIRVDGGTDRVGDIGVYLVPHGPVGKIPDRVPEMIFEIVSPDRRSRDRDYQEKRAEYYKFGVREYVIVDRFARRVTVLTHAPGGYQERVLGAADTYTSPLLPGLAIPLAEVF
jgi:Uma2 family endonuclease